MKTKVKLDHDTFEVKSHKGFSMGNGAAGGYTFISEAEYYIVVEEHSVKLKSIFNDIEYNTVLEEVDSLNHTFKIKGKEYKYKICE